MNTGMLWFDNEKNKSIENKLKDCIEYFIKKHSVEIDFIRINPDMPAIEEYNSIKIERSTNVLMNHFYIIPKERIGVE